MLVSRVTARVALIPPVAPLVPRMNAPVAWSHQAVRPVSLAIAANDIYSFQVTGKP